MSQTLLTNALCKKLHLKWPLIQAPMGGLTTAKLVATVSETGALGFLGAAYMPPAVMEETINDVKKRTQRSFGVNLFAPTKIPHLSAQQINSAIQATHAYRAELGISDPQIQAPFDESFDEQFAVLLKCKPAVFSYTFGLISKEMLKECRQQQIITLGTATTLEEGLLLQEYGVDGVIAQGMEAGGHRGAFSPEQCDPLIGTLALTCSLLQELNIPVIASGGIMDGAQIATALILGAQAVQLGTAFLLCQETSTSPAYREQIRKAKDHDTQLTRAFSGRWARGIKNRFMVEMEHKDQSILPFPAQNAFTRDIRKKAAELGRAEFLSLWAGHGVSATRQMNAQELVQILYEETLKALHTNT
ncbi:MAG: nitronate monooxygenase [Legionella sp.]|uniref:NAD(P)H-dependent flavin oxidoreductase n=1 Tax=Legionella sp. TaxID=459 RepID=UPI0039E5AB1C